MSDFKESSVYPVIFMMLISVVFVGVLAVFFRSSEQKIKDHQTREYETMVVNLLSGSIAEATGLDPTDLTKDVSTTMETYVDSLSGYSRPAYQAMVEAKPIAYLFDIKGKGLWGSMAALVAVDTELKTILDFAIYNQMETPGLGSRITEEGFRKQFSGKTAIEDSQPKQFTLVPEGQAEISPDQIRQITGATITSNSVLKMLSDELALLYNDKVKTNE